MIYVSYTKIVWRFPGKADGGCWNDPKKEEENKIQKALTEECMGTGSRNVTRKDTLEGCAEMRLG